MVFYKDPTDPTDPTNPTDSKGLREKITALNDGGSIATFDYNGGGLLLCFVLGGITMIWLSEEASVKQWCFWSFLLPNHVILMACVPGAG